MWTWTIDPEDDSTLAHGMSTLDRTVRTKFNTRIKTANTRAHWTNNRNISIRGADETPDLASTNDFFHTADV